MKKMFSLVFSALMIITMLAACAPKATVVPTEAAASEDTIVSMVPAKPGSPFDITGKKVCYIIPSLANPFLNGVATSVTAQVEADGVEVSVYGADEGG